MHTEMSQAVTTPSSIIVEAAVCSVSVVCGAVGYGAAVAKKCHWTVRRAAGPSSLAPSPKHPDRKPSCRARHLIECPQVPVIFALEAAEHGISASLGDAAFLVLKQGQPEGVPIPWVKLACW